MSTRIAIATGGGDCPGLNAVIRAVAKAAAKRGWETLGFFGGYEDHFPHHQNGENRHKQQHSAAESTQVEIVHGL